MDATHVANPVHVKAARILEVTNATKYEDGCGQSSPDLMLRLEDGRNFLADSGMTARYVPVAGDYVVEQEDGYAYLNPKDVFERKYRPIVVSDTVPRLDTGEDREFLRENALDAALRTPGIGGTEGVLTAARQFFDFLKGQS